MQGAVEAIKPDQIIWLPETGARDACGPDQGST